jgi:D-glycero-D-manno-heptose 1,7-bisphosphate phosphatase
MLKKFKDNNIDILDVLYCPHSPNSNCLCRKPKPGLIFEAYKKFQINIKESWLIGDQETDIETAKAAGINNTILVKSGHPVDELNSNASFILKSINECSLIINN